MTYLGHPAHRLGLVQRAVLMVLAAEGEATVDDIEYHTHWVSEASARAAIHSLARRGLVDVSGWGSTRNNRDARAFKLTAKGIEVEAALLRDDSTEDEVASR